LEINNAKLGLKKTGNNLLLIIVNAFVGGMIGMERTIIQSLPRLNLVSLQKAILFYSRLWNYQAVSNYFAGKLANRYGRKICFIWMVLALPIRLF
jgi:hypothetical protein